MSLIPFDHKSYFQLLQEELGTNIKLAVWLEDMLDISRPSAYKRISGDTQLTVSELLTIAKYCPQTARWASDLYQPQPLRLFHLHQTQTVEEVEKQLIELENLLLSASKYEDFHWDYSAHTLPLFYFFKHPALLKYKLKLWTHSLFDHKEIRVPESLTKKANDLWNLYRFLPTTELWNTEAFIFQEKTILNEVQIGCIKQEESKDLLKALKELKLELRQSARQREKKHGGKLTMHYTPSFTMNNGSRIYFNGTTHLFSTFHGIQYYQTSSPQVLELFDASWQQHLKLSQEHNGISEPMFLFSA